MFKVRFSTSVSGVKSYSSVTITRSKQARLRKFLFCSILLIIGLTATVLAQVEMAIADETTVDGSQDPIQDSMLFRDDELFIGYWEGGEHGDLGLASENLNVRAPTSDDLTSWETQMTRNRTAGYALDELCVSSATGRIADPKRDQAVVVFTDYQLSYETLVQLNDLRQGYDAPLKEVIIRSPEPRCIDYEFIDVAVGDLDRVIGEDSVYHDEIVVVQSALCTSSGSAVGPGVMVDVLDYNLNVIASYDFPGSYRNVAVSIGDLNGDHKKDIAIAMVQPDTDGNKYAVATGMFDAEKLDKEPIEYSLTFNSIKSGLTWDGHWVDLACADFKGDGKQQLIASGGKHFYVFTTDSALELTQQWTGKFDDKFSSTDGHQTRLLLAPGLFHFDQMNGYDINRRQLAVAVLRHDSRNVWLKVDTFDVGDTDDENGEYKLVSKGYWRKDLGDMKDFQHYNLAVTAGNFVGHGQSGEETSPVMQLAVSGQVWKGEGSSYNHEFWYVLNISSDLKDIDQVQGFKGTDSYYCRTYFMSAADTDNDSWFIAGPAIHLSVEHLTQVTNLIQEPPKHLDYLPHYQDIVDQKPESEWTWEVTPKVATQNFYVQLGLTSEESLKMSNTRTSSYSIGAGASLDYHATLSAGFLKIMRATVSISASLKASYQYDSSKSKLDWNDSEEKETITADTSFDDYICGQYQVYDIWEYPIEGLKIQIPDQPDYQYGYYQVIVPGARITLTGAGLGVREYQPVHENHNLLSYPVYHSDLPSGAEGSFWTPPDLGSFTIPGSDEEVKTVMNNQYHIIRGGNDIEQDMEFKNTAGEGSAKKYSNKFSENLDLSYGASASVKMFIQADVGLTAKFNLNSSQSWGESETAKQETSNTMGLKLKTPAMPDPTLGYAYTSAAYVSSQGGMFKVAHAVDPLGSADGAHWWTVQYGDKADPALNLPNRFTLHKAYGDERDDYYELTEGENKYNIRGFFLRDGEENPVTQQHEELTVPIYAGDTVKLCVRVYNYSFKDTGSFNVKFYYVKWDGIHYTGTPVLVGTAPVGNLDSVTDTDAVSMKEVNVDWDTTGLDTTSGYRFIVHLDEENKVDEVHEGWKGAFDENVWEEFGFPLLCNNDNEAECDIEVLGGNNIGYYPMTNPVNVWTPKSDNQLTAPAPMPSLSEKALMIEMEDGFVSDGEIGLITGQNYKLRVHVRTENNHLNNFLAQFYDGNPENGGTLISSEIIKGSPGGGAYIYTDYKPDTNGKHRIWARLIGNLRDAEDRNNWETLDVEVDDDNDDTCDDDSCFISTLN